MPYCPICEIGFRDKRGLKGHFRFKHRLEYDTGKPARDTAFTKAIGRNIERRVSGDTMMKAIEEEKRSEQLDSGISGFEGLRKALRDEPQNRLEGFEGLKKGLKRWK